MPQPLYLTITTSDGSENLSTGAGSVESIGTAGQDSHPDENICQAIAYHVTMPRDPQAGQPSGRRIHMPASVTKFVDKSSPLLLNAIASGKQLKIVANFYRTTKVGGQENYYRVTFGDVTLVDLNPYTPDVLNPQNVGYRDMEEVKFTYKSVDVDHLIASTSGSDDWSKA